MKAFAQPLTRNSEVEVLAVIKRKEDDIEYVLHRHNSFHPHHPRSVEEIADNKRNTVEVVFVSEEYKKISRDEIRRKYTWTQIQPGSCRYVQQTNAWSVLDMKPEVTI
ncbi:hypothetical protein_gp256 [Bacillus phage vB_BceM_WH1]|nr:hypothetical protein_gp256 [Bacillus phage vB_BceM_WH1]